MRRRALGLALVVALICARAVSAAVAFDASSESHTGTTGDTSHASFSWTHAPSGTPKGVIVCVYQLSTTDVGSQSTDVTYGGTSMTPIGFARDTAGEPGFVKMYFLGASVPSGSQTVVVNRNNNTDVMYATAATVTASTSTTDVAGIVTLQDDGTLAEQSVTDQSPGTNSVRFACAYSGLASPPSAGTNSTALQSIDIGANGAAMVRETTAGQGSRAVGFSSGTSDDRAVIHIAVREPPSAATWSLVAHTSAQGNNTFSTSAISCTGANLIVGVSGWNSASEPTYSDSSGTNTYSTLTAVGFNNTQMTRIIYVISPSVSGSMTFTATGSSIAASLAIACFSVTGSAVFDVQNGATTNGITVAAGTITPNVANELVIVGIGMTDGVAAGAPDKFIGGYPRIDVTADNSGFMIAGLGYGVQGSATATNPSVYGLNAIAPTTMNGLVASFKAVSAATTAPMLTLMGAGPGE